MRRTATGECHRLLRCLAAIVFVCALGCSAERDARQRHRSGTAGPHGGPAVELPNGAGYAEITVEFEPGSGGTAEQARVAVYFYGKDMQTALEPAPTHVAVQLVSPDGPAESLTLVPVPRADDRVGGLRFASLPGLYLIDEPVGELTVNLGGQSTRLPFAGVR